LDDAHIDARMLELKARDGARQDHRAEDRAGADHDAAPPAFDQFVDLALRAAELAEDEARAPLQRAAERRWPHAMRRAIEHRAADAALQQLDAARQCRLAGLQAARRVAERAAFDDGEKISQITKFQIHAPHSRIGRPVLRSIAVARNSKSRDSDGGENDLL